MSRRASLFAKQNPDKPRPKVRFSDELVFLDNIKVFVQFILSKEE
jgi:hypothetical protein